MSVSPIFRDPFDLLLPGGTGDARSEISEADGSTPLFEALVRAWGGASFYNCRTAP